VVKSTALSPRERRRAESEDRRRTELLDEATLVFAEKGFHETQMAEIAASAEFSKATLYTLFGSKEELYREVVLRAIRRMRSEVQASVSAVDEPGERLLVLIDALFEVFEANSEVVQLVLNGAQGLPWRVRQTMDQPSLRAIEGFQTWLIELCEDAERAGAISGLDARTFAIAMLGTFTNVASDALKRAPHGSLKDQAQAVRELFSSSITRARQQ